MAKIMVVEDDQSLREIYSIRLTAEGYEIVSAGDGEEALAIAVKERPDLIISDVMMPKISGFDMLDILRSTPETRDIKVIMMTALSSDDQRKRGESLGADKYLVKSQVGIEDVIAAVKEVLEGAPVAPAVAQAAPAPTPAQPAPAPAVPGAAPVAQPAPVPTPVVATPVPPVAPASASVPPVVAEPAPVANPEPAPVAPAMSAPAPAPQGEMNVPAAQQPVQSPANPAQ